MTKILLILLSVASANAFAGTICFGQRTATNECPAQKVQLLLDYYEPGSFDLQTVVGPNYKRPPTPYDPCYEITSGMVKGQSLIASRKSDFFPNYGGIPLSKPVLAGILYETYGHIILNDRFTNQKIELSCK